MRPINRIEPKAGPDAFKTYTLAAPTSSHRRRATCAEVECIRRMRGFRALFDSSTPEGRRNCASVERSNRSYSREVIGSMVSYTFPAGQDCFNAHTVPLEREPFYSVNGGDYRGNPLQIPTRRHTRAEHWVEDFAEHQDQIDAQQRRG